MTKSRIDALQRFYKFKKIDVKLEFEIVGRYDYDAIVEKINYLIDTNDDCCFDLTGGKELVLAAMGEVSAKRIVPMVQFNVRTGDFIKVKNCEDYKEPENTPMLIEESVILNGGAVVFNKENKINWKLTDEFKSDIETIWEICKSDCATWNKQSVVFGSLEKHGILVDNLSVKVNVKALSTFKQDIFNNSKIIEKLVNSGLLVNYSLNNDILTYSYKNAQIRRCILKAGNILEVYAYNLMHKICEEKPEYFDDIKNGIIVDWDGRIYPSSSEIQETRNEIDIMLTRGLVPFFISCKNGEVEKEALYELDSVAEKFGGKYARKVLLASYLNSDDERRQYLLQRAHDMNITVIYGVEKMDKNKFKEVLYNQVR